MYNQQNVYIGPRRGPDEIQKRSFEAVLGNVTRGVREALEELSDELSEAEHEQEGRGEDERSTKMGRISNKVSKDILA